MPLNGSCNIDGYFLNDTTKVQWSHVSTIETNEYDLEEVFRKGNWENENVRSLSVGDIIVDQEDNAFMVKGLGFEKIEFSPKYSMN
jgi:hypothetical protein